MWRVAFNRTNNIYIIIRIGIGISGEREEAHSSCAHCSYHRALEKLSAVDCALFLLHGFYLNVINGKSVNISVNYILEYPVSINISAVCIKQLFRSSSSSEAAS